MTVNRAPEGGAYRRPRKNPRWELLATPGRVMSLLVLGVVAVLFITVVVSGRAGFVEVKDTEAALVVNYLTGEREVIVRPGYQIFVPVIQQAFIFDKSPQEFVMQGDKDVSANHVAKLTVRANDGSNFWFDEIKIQYELNQDRTDYVLEDSGPGEGFKQNWVRAYARSLLRDEFGKFSAIDVADPTAFKTATMEAERLLNEMLDPHGVHILQIITPRPKFEENYERAIEDRKVANQEVEKLKTRAEQLIQERERRLAEIDSKRAVEFEALKGELEARRIDAERDQVRTERSADAYQAQRVGEGQATKAALLAEAGGLTDKARKEAEGLRAITAALEKGGEVLVRERLAQLLGEVEFELIPYNRDPSPTRIELLQDTAATTALQGGH